jgi:ankyrin repeat protein
VLLLLLLLSQAYAHASGPASSSLVQLLLQHGATAGNPNAAVCENYKTLRGVTPLQLLACWHPGIVASSSSSIGRAKTPASEPGGSSSSKMAAAGEEGMSAEDRAGVAEQLAAATLLLEQPAEGGSGVNVQWGHLQDTPLAAAAGSGAYDFAAWLISKGADVNLPRKGDAARPLDLAVCHGHTKLAYLLLQHGAEVSCSVDDSRRDAAGVKTSR